MLLVHPHPGVFGNLRFVPGVIDTFDFNEDIGATTVPERREWEERSCASEIFDRVE
jgi:hypothetical protein